MNAFENLKYQQIRTLIDVLSELEDRGLELIKKRYKNASANFEGAKEFLRKLKLLEEKDGRISIAQAIRQSDTNQISDNVFKRLLLNELLSTNSSLSSDVQFYLNNFKLVRNSFEYKPSTSSRLRESGIRNVFMELDLIEYDRTSGVYVIKQDHFDSFEAYLKRNKLSPKELAFILERKNTLGKAAELEVLRFERLRLAGYPELLSKIDHVALDDVTAGYDILSWETKRIKGQIVPRYIEVKATSKSDNVFYWSRTEVDKAKELGVRYYLYLLPVKSSKVFDIDNLEIIQNPIVTVLNNSKGWSREVESYQFSRNVKN